MSENKEGPYPLGAEKGPAKLNTTTNIHEELSKFKTAFPLPELSEVYRNPYLTEGSNGIFPINESENVPNFTRAGRFSLNNFENLSIDKISILFSAPANRRDTPYTKRYWDRFEKVLEHGRFVRSDGNNLYEHSGKCFDDFYVSWGFRDRGAQNIKIEFNPNKADLDCLAVLFACMKKHTLGFARISRLDIAIDYAMFINPLSWVAENFVQEQVYKCSGLVKTLYFGSPQSDLQIRIYDKAFELQKKQKIMLGYEFWRVEAQVRSVKGQSIQFTLPDEIISYNPFERLTYCDQYGHIPAGKGGFALFLDSARAYGVQHASALLDWKTRKKYLATIKEYGSPLPFNQPAEIYKNCIKSLYIRFLNHLSGLFEKGQQYKLV